MTDEVLLEKLRSFCLSLPEVSETNAWGHPNFKAGKRTFAAFESYGGGTCVCFKAELAHQHVLVEDARFFVAPYGSQQGWVCMRVKRESDWQELKKLLLMSYRGVALQRMLKALEGAAR